MSDVHEDFLDDFQSNSSWESLEDDNFDEVVIDVDAENLDLAEQLHGFLLRTSELTESEQAELLGAFIEDVRRSGGRHPGETDWGQIAQGIRTGLSLFQTGAQVAGGIAGAFGGNNRTARDVALWSRRLGQGAGLAQNVLGTISPGQRPRQPTRQAPRQAQRRAPRRHTGVRTGRAAPGRRPAPGQTRSVARYAPANRLPLNNTAQLASLLNNPQILQALRSTLLRGREGVLSIEADSTSSFGGIALSEVMNTIAHLAQESVYELNTLSGKEDEYFDTEQTEDRDEQVLFELRQLGELIRFNNLDDYVAMDGAVEDEMNDSDVWAREAGFDS